MAISAASIQQYLHGVTYPMDKEEMINRAKENGASDDVISVMKQFPEKEYKNPTEVSRAFSSVHSKS